MKRSQRRLSLELLQEILSLEGRILDIQVNHRDGMATILYEGNVEVGEGYQAAYETTTSS